MKLFDLAHRRKASSPACLPHRFPRFVRFVPRHPPVGHRRGQVWDEVQTLNKIIHNTHFNLTGKSMQVLELAYMSSVNANADRINGQIMSQVDKDTTVRSVYLFGKKHRPDLTINDDGSRLKSNTHQSS